MSPISLGDSAWLHFGTTNVATGAATDADSTPVVNLAEDGAAMGYSPVVSSVAPGLYIAQVDCTTGNGFEAGRRYSVYATATVGGITGRDGIGEFEVLALDINATLNATVASRLSLNQFLGLK